MPGWPGPRSSVYASCIVGITGMHCRAQLFIGRDCSLQLLPMLASNTDPPNLLLLSRQDYRCESLHLG
jgi:hypothetical protein